MAPKTQPLDERIRQLQAEIDQFIDDEVVKLKETCPGVPEPVLRNTLMARSSGCLCQAYRNIQDGGHA